VDSSEHDQVDDLLRSANAALNSKPELEIIPGEADGEDTKPAGQAHKLPDVDLSAFQPEPESDDETTTDAKKHSKNELRTGLNQEADDVLQRLLDEVKYEQKQNPAPADRYNDDGNDDDESDNDRSEVSPNNTTTTSTKPLPTTSNDPFSALSLPSAPTTLPIPPPATNLASSTSPDDSSSSLAARFASLSLPTSTSASSSSPSFPSVPTSTRTEPQPQYSDDEIDSWCIICSDDATLRCKGCDGDLYCTNCWLEGHRGEDAGLEERRHRAEEFVKGKKKKKKERRMVGA
jgi:hypothetical protein